MIENELFSGSEATCPPITLSKGSAIYFQDTDSEQYVTNTMAVIICPLGQVPSESLLSFCKNGAWAPSFGVCEPLLPKVASKLISFIL
ncbi:unnamed protein product [Gongylonema pulchrum]|uniref:Sushi domain-containing protein n=1 Tax=Gongylonema pulchrum TaxID=637853 RepID=A0A183CUR1_9BILA|nr:unnamed protein product [Gongylonema pulchrum]